MFISGQNPPSIGAPPNLLHIIVMTMTNPKINAPRVMEFVNLAVLALSLTHILSTLAALHRGDADAYHNQHLGSLAVDLALAFLALKSFSKKGSILGVINMGVVYAALGISFWLQ